MGRIAEVGYEDVTVQKLKEIVLPDDILSDYMDTEEISKFKSGSTGIYSITVFGKKPRGAAVFFPVTEEAQACTPGGGCC